MSHEDPQTPNEALPSIDEETARAIGEIAIHGPYNDAPRSGTRLENWLRPERPFTDTTVLVSDARAARRESKDRVAVSATVQTLQALEARQYRTSHNRPDIGFEDPVIRRRSGSASYIGRRMLDSVISFRGKRSPSDHIADERTLALRKITQMVGVDKVLADIAEKDPTSAVLLRERDISGLRSQLGELVRDGTLPETCPLHPRWNQAMAPENIRALRQYLVSTAGAIGANYKTMNGHLDGAGIMTPDRFMIIADYFGVAPEAWLRQVSARTTPNSTAGPEVVPVEVVDQVNFLLKLAGTHVRTARVKVKPADGSEVIRSISISALDEVISSQVIQPWIDVPETLLGDPLYQNPMDRINKHGSVLNRSEAHSTAYQVYTREIEQQRNPAVYAQRFAASESAQLKLLLSDLEKLPPTDLLRIDLESRTRQRLAALEKDLIRFSQPRPRQGR